MGDLSLVPPIAGPAVPEFADLEAELMAKVDRSSAEHGARGGLRRHGAADIWHQPALQPQLAHPLRAESAFVPMACGPHSKPRKPATGFARKGCERALES